MHIAGTKNCLLFRQRDKTKFAALDYTGNSGMLFSPDTQFTY